MISYPNTLTRLKCVEIKIQAARELVSNTRDPRRTISQFESAFSVKDPNFVEKCYLMIEFDPQSYEQSSHDPIWLVSIEY